MLSPALVIIPIMATTISWAMPPTLVFKEAWNLNEKPVCPSGNQDPRLARRVLPKLVRDWHQHGGALLQETETLIGKPWERKELTFFHHVCPDFPDLSSPPSIQMHPLLHATKANESRTLIEMRDTVWHELLHGYIDSMIDLSEKTTPLLDKNAAENDAVRVHLHLMAIQLLIYEKLGRQADAAIVREFYARNRLADYARAWDIALKDGPQAYVNELKTIVGSNRKR